MATYKQNADGSIDKTIIGQNGQPKTYNVNVNDPKWKSIAQEAVTVGGIKGAIDKTPSNNSTSKASNEAGIQRPELRGLGLADKYGLTYDADEIQGKFDAATKAQYDVLRKEYKNTENDYYDQLFGTQATAMDAIRKNNAAAVATGASRGMQAANELSATLGIAQESTGLSTDLAQSRNLLMDKEQAAYAKNATDALTSANSARQGIANLDANMYAADTQFNVGQMDYYARLDQASKGLMGVQAQNEANKMIAELEMRANMYSTDMNYAGQDLVSARNLQGQQGANAAARNYGSSYAPPATSPSFNDVYEQSKNDKVLYIGLLQSQLGYSYEKASEAWLEKQKAYNAKFEQNPSATTGSTDYTPQLDVRRLYPGLR